MHHEDWEVFYMKKKWQCSGTDTQPWMYGHSLWKQQNSLDADSKKEKCSVGDGR